jgi:hypothetical protein
LCPVFTWSDASVPLAIFRHLADLVDCC